MSGVGPIALGVLALLAALAGLWAQRSGRERVSSGLCWLAAALISAGAALAWSSG